MAWREEFIQNIELRMRGRAEDNVQRPMKGSEANTEHRTLKTTEENAQHPTSNGQRPMRRAGSSFCVLLCGSEAGEKNPDQLLRFGQDGRQTFLGKHPGFVNQAKPPPGFFELFQANPELVHEV